MNKKISFVIPCYNSEKTIEYVVNDIVSTINKITSYDYEIVLVNDCSLDNTIITLKKLAKNSKIKIIDLNKNYGQHAAILTGLRYTTGEIIIFLDDDGQTPPEECKKIIYKIEEGFDVVYAKYITKHHSSFRNFGSKINSIMMCLLLNKPKDLYISSYFGCKKYIADEISKYTNPYPYIQGLVLRSTNNISNVIVEHKDRKEGKSGYSFIKLFSLWMNGFTSFSIKPLRVASFLGMVSALIGFIYSIILIIRKLTNHTTVLGYSSIMATLLIIGGITMILLGLIGEYLGRIFICINNFPQAIIKEAINIDKYKKK